MSSRLTKYEIARLIGVRASQISNGATPMVDTENLINPLEIAEKELNEGKIPIDIVRKLPNGTSIIVSVCK